MAAVRRLNHAVLYVTDAALSAAFYTETLGFDVAYEGSGFAFLRSAGSPNDHDLGLFSIGAAPPPSARHTGLYHLAWQVDTIEELIELRGVLLAKGSLVGESDHGVSKSLYATDPDGIEFEVMWAVPAADRVPSARPLRLDLAAAQARWAKQSTLRESNPV
jgi:catechol-2,3-dioxygenase